MNKDIKELHLMQRLIERLNTEVFETSYTVIANYLISNHKNITHITIEDICREALVSKSTVRRFCNSIGYKNFSELKKAYLLVQDYAAPSFDMKIEMADVLDSVLSIEESVVERIAKEILIHKNIFILGSYNLYSCLYEFQRGMLYQGKTIFLLPNIDLHFKEAKNRMNEGLVILVDFDDSYLNSILPFVSELKSSRILFTNQTKALINANVKVNFDYSPYESLKKYQLMFFLDRIVQKYHEIGNV